jgi:hypothetical protein
LPVVPSDQFPEDGLLKTGSCSSPSKVSRIAVTSQSPCRSTDIHCGSPSAARQPVPRTPGELIPSTANSAGVGA